MSNFLNYTNLTYEEILQAIKNKVSTDSRFSNLNESAIAQMLFEIFAGAVDLCNYNLERRAEENYFDTCKLRSSAILLAKQLGYVITRPIPAESTIKVKISGDLTSKNIQTDDILQLPIYTNFTFDNNSFLLKNTFSYTFTSADVSALSADTNYEKTISLDDNGDSISIVQGEKETKVIEGETNHQVGQKFQIYKIEDLEFSNKYGSEDYDTDITTVKVGKTSATADEYDIDRRSLINLESIENFVIDDSKKICVIRTANDENIELLFGDAQYAALGATVSANGPTTVYDNIYIQYLSTKGSAANQTGVIDKKLNSSVSVSVGGNDITSNTEFLFATNIIGGADMEDIDSIKLNAPSIYYSLDRLVSKRDYIAYLKSLTSPINIKNAIVWGEQDEMRLTDNNPIKKLFNVVLFSCLGSLYNLTDSNYSVKTNNNNLDTALLDLDYDEDVIKSQNYFNVYVKQNIAQQLESYETSGSFYILYGNVVDLDAEDFVTRFNNWKFTYTYDSMYYLSGTDAYGTTSAINLSGASTSADIATAIQTALRAEIDERGSSAINDNYGNNCFSNLTCTYDTNNSRFVFSGSPNDTCYLKLAHFSSFTSAVGIYGKGSNKATLTLNDNSLISSKITEVINKLNIRSQVTLKDIYVSPILQNFNLNGNIYVNKLADKTDLHRKIKNALYVWLDKNADFNENIYLSNIIEVAEDFPNVHHVNLTLSGTPVSYTAFVVSTDSLINKPMYSDETNLQARFTTFYNTINNNSDLTERIFFEQVKVLYDALDSSNSNHTPFRDTDDFITAISNIHKEFALRIKNNMIDANGDITNYSIGNEVVKININTTIYYQT